MDQDDTLEILESNVQDIQTVFVTEERIKDGSEVMYNDQQIKGHITNLLYNNNNDDKNLLSKVDNYFTLFKTYNENLQTKQHVYVLHPIIQAFKHTYYIDSDEYVPDKDTEDQLNIEMSPFKMFISKFAMLQNDRQNPYTVTSRNLYSMWKPFTTVHYTDVENVKRNIDVKDTKNRYYRVIPSANNYDGDVIKVVGFYNKNKNEQDDDDNKLDIDWDTYMANITSLKNGDKVTAVFNDFVFVKDKLITFLTGEYKDGQIMFTKTIRLHNILTSYVPVSSSAYFVFPKATPIFSKKDIFSKNCSIVSGNIIGRDIYNTIHPNNVTEALYIIYDSINVPMTFQSINDALSIYGYSLADLHETSRHILEYVLSYKLKTILVKTKTPVPTSIRKVHKDTTQIALLENIRGDYWEASLRRDKGLYDIISSFLTLWTQRIDSIQIPVLKDKLRIIETYITKLKSSIKETKNTCNTNANINITKKYTSYQDLLNDNSKVCYWDTEYDTTNYSYKNKIKDVEVTVSAIKALLLTKKRYISMTESEVDTEAKSIYDGKRKVRIGEHAILEHETTAETLLFERKNVQGEDMWVKISKYDNCEKYPLKMVELNDSCVYDSYDKTCKKMDNYKISKSITRFEQYRDIMKYALHVCRGGQFPVLESLSQLIRDYYTLLRSHGYDSILRNIPLHKYGISQSFQIQNPENMEGEYREETFEELSNHLEAQDYDNKPMPLTSKTTGSHSTHRHDQKIYVHNIIVDHLDITFKEEHLTYVHNAISRKYNVAEMRHQELVRERDKLMAKVDMTLYTSNKAFKSKVDAKVNERLGNVMKEVSKYYYEELVYAIALVTTMIHSLYPQVDIKRMVPGCTSHFASIGYPLIDSTTKALDVYIISALKKFTITNDIRYDVFMNTSLNDIIKNVRDNIDNIIQEDYILSQSIEMRKSMYKNVIHTRKQFMMKPLRNMYKPCFKYDKIKSTLKSPAITLLKEIHDKIVDSDYSIVSITNTIFMANACCPQKLDENVDYYRELRTDSSIRALLTKLHLSNVVVNHSSFIPYQSDLIINKLQNKTRTSSALNKPKPMSIIKHSNNIDIPHDDTKLYMNNIADDAEFDNIILPGISTQFAKMRDLISRTIDNIDESVYNTIDKILIRGENSKIKETRNALYTFVRSKFHTLLGRFKHKYVPKNTTTHDINIIGGIVQQIGQNKDPLVVIVDKINNNIEYNRVITNAFHVGEINKDDIAYYDIEDTNDVINAVKNTAMLMEYIVSTCLHIIQYPIENNMTISCIRISCSIVDFILTALYTYYTNNVLDTSNIMKRIEELREKRKQDEMNSYDTDDEKRAMQIEYRNLGVPGWSSMFDDPTTNTVDNNQTVTNGILDLYDTRRNDGDDDGLDGPNREEFFDYNGENMDGDVDEDVDFARQYDN